LAVGTLFGSGEITVVELEDELPPPEFGAQAVAPDRAMAAGFQFVNHGSRPITNLELALEIDGRPVQTEHVSVEPNGSASVTFAPFTPAAGGTRATVRSGAPISLNVSFMTHSGPLLRAH
jgi:hypothetical protein